MNIAVICGSDHLEGGGFQQELSTILLLKYHSNKKYNFVFYSANKDNINILKKYNIKINYIGITNLNKILDDLRLNKYINKIMGGFSFFKYNKFDDVMLNDEIDLIYSLYAFSIASSTEHFNYITTVWDLCHKDYMEFPEIGNSKIFFYRENKYIKVLSRATAIITESETGRNNIIRRYNIDSERVITIPFITTNQVKITEKDYKENFLNVKNKYNIYGDYIFYPAQFWAHKNHVYILDALIIMKEKHNIKLNAVFTGSDKGNLKYIKEYVRKIGITDQVFFIGFVEEEEMPYLYKQSIALVMPTYLGPTNLPPLEAFSLECPVCYSDLPGLRDQVKDAAFLVDLNDPESLVISLLKIINNKDLVNEKIKKGKLIIRELSEEMYWNSLKKIFDRYIKIMKSWKDV